MCGYEPDDQLLTIGEGRLQDVIVSCLTDYFSDASVTGKALHESEALSISGHKLESICAPSGDPEGVDTKTAHHIVAGYRS